MKSAMRAHDSVRLDVIRFLRSELKRRDDHGQQTDDGIYKIIARQIKSMQDANASMLRVVDRIWSTEIISNQDS